MVYRSGRQAREALQDTALAQGGYFTAGQARAAGYERGHLAYHVRVGNFERVGWGLYRLPGLPPSKHDDLIRWTLWSRDREGKPQATIGHESALAVHELGDGMPAHVHLIVPVGFRKEPPVACELHVEDLAPKDIEEHEGYFVTTPLRTLLDLAARPGFSTAALRQAVAEAQERGLVRSRELRAIATREALTGRLGLAPSKQKRRKG